MKILHVDDSKAMRMIVQRTVKMAGFSDLTFVEAENGRHGLEVLEAEKPDVILSDWNMPEMNGLEFLKKIREADNPITFGFITSESNPETRQEALDAGASFVITKPFTPEAFEQQLTPVFAQLS